MPATFERLPDGRLRVEIDQGEVLPLMTEPELSRRCGRSPSFVLARIESGLIRPVAETGAGVRLYLPDALVALSKETVVRNGQHIETATIR